jgi:hypothetical protein
MGELLDGFVVNYIGLWVRHDVRAKHSCKELRYWIFDRECFAPTVVEKDVAAAPKFVSLRPERRVSPYRMRCFTPVSMTN